MRDALGVSYTDTVQTDAIEPSRFNINMFTADELLNNGSGLINYYGYDFKGNE